MAVTFSLADETAYGHVRRMIRRWHTDLDRAGVEVGVIFAAAEDGPSIKSKGAAVAATMQVVSLKDRVLKEVDAQMVIALEVWKKLDDDQRHALVDHELTHLALKHCWTVTVKGADGEPTGETEFHCERDDLGRPKLVTVPGDIDVGDAFEAVIKRHGPAAMEYRSLTKAGRWAEQALDDAGGEAEEGGGEGLGPDSPFANAEVTYKDETGEVVTRRVDFTKLKDLHAGAEEEVA